MASLPFFFTMCLSTLARPPCSLSAWVAPPSFFFFRAGFFLSPPSASDALKLSCGVGRRRTCLPPFFSRVTAAPGLVLGQTSLFSSPPLAEHAEGPSVEAGPFPLLFFFSLLLSGRPV